MTTTKKLAIAVVALSLVLVGVIGGTLAYLIDESDEVTNTFTYGQIEIELWETDPTSNEKTTTGVEYARIVPGAVVNKNPTVTVKAKSEDCWVYVMVTNNVVLNGTAVATYTVNTDWEEIATNGTSKLYRYNTKVEYSTSAQDTSAVFSKVKFADNLTVANITALKASTDANIVVKAYAHQATVGVEQDTADTAAIAWFNGIVNH